MGNIHYILKWYNLVWSLLMGADAIVYACLGDMGNTIWNLGMGTVSYMAYEFNKGMI